MPSKTAPSQPLRRPWYRLHVTTLIVAAVAVSPIVLSNLVEEEEFAYVDTSIPGGRKLSEPEPQPINLITLPGTPALVSKANVIVANEYGWPCSWLWMDCRAPGPFVAGRWAARYRALVMNVLVCLLFVAVTGAAAECLRRRLCPRLQCSVRTLLLAVAACGILLAVGTWLHRSALRQDAITSKIETAEGGVHLKRWGPRWLKVLGADRFRRRVTAVTLAGTEPSDLQLRELLQDLKDFPRMTGLDLENTKLSDAGAEALSQLTAIEELYLNNTAITDAGLRRVSLLPHLKLLHLGGCSVTDDGVAQLRRCKNLELLFLSETQVEGYGLGKLSGLSQLRVLDLTRCTIEDAQLKCISSLRQLEGLYLGETEITEGGIGRAARLPRLRLLDVSGNVVNNRAWEAISHSNSLEELVVDAQEVTPQRLVKLLAARRLKHVHVADGSQTFELRDGRFQPSDFDFGSAQSDRRSGLGQRVLDIPPPADGSPRYGLGFF